MLAISAIPQEYQSNLERAVKILKQGGCSEIYLFGSLATGEFDERSDIDLAVRGCPSGRFFQLLGELMMSLDYPVDLVSLDKGDLFARYLEEEGELYQIG